MNLKINRCCLFAREGMGKTLFQKYKHFSLKTTSRFLDNVFSHKKINSFLGSPFNLVLRLSSCSPFWPKFTSTAHCIVYSFGHHHLSGNASPRLHLVVPSLGTVFSKRQTSSLSFTSSYCVLLRAPLAHLSLDMYTSS